LLSDKNLIESAETVLVSNVDRHYQIKRQELQIIYKTLFTFRMNILTLREYKTMSQRISAPKGLRYVALSGLKNKPNIELFLSDSNGKVRFL